MIKVYSKTVCPQCRMVKKFLEDKGVPFEDINVEKNEEAKTYLQSLGFQTVPVTVSGDEIVVGFAIDKLRELV